MSKPNTLLGGWLAGHKVYVARADCRCEYFRGKSQGGYCDTFIAKGERYCAGEERARYCFACAGYNPASLTPSQAAE